MKLTTHIVEKPWGQTGLPARFGVDPERRIGEIWYQVPADATPTRSLGVMIKYLFTSERLSIQVHPNDAQAQAAGQPRGKEEAWVVIDAAPDAHIGVGLRAAVSADALRAAALDGSIEGMIDWRPARRGDVIYNPAGTIHAIGPGLIIAEVQQAVDLTYRLYDYGRLDNGRLRELHLDAGLAVANPAPHHDPRDTRLPDDGGAVLLNGPLFGMAWCDGAVADAVPQRGRVQVLPIDGDVRVAGEVVRPGECALADDVAMVSIAEGVCALLAWDCAEMHA